MSSPAANSQLIDVVFETLRAHVEGMTPEQQLSFSEKVLSLSPTPAATSPAESNIITDSPPALRPHRGTSRNVRSRIGRGKKAVNAFMVFRAYISPVLGKMPQKCRSPLLSVLWRAEQRQSQFHLLGAAFTKIRDECRDCPSLEKFLEVASGAVSIIPADRYLELTGWRLVDEGDSKGLTSAFVDENKVVTAYPLQTHVSTQEIIEHCFDFGLINTVPETSTIPAPRDLSAISFAARPQNHDLAPAQTIADAELDTIDMLDPLSFFNFNDASSGTDYSPSFELITQDQQQAYQNSPASAHWLPSIQPPILGIDPNTIQDEFDPFSFDIGTFSTL